MERLYLARKITRSKWDPKPYTGEGVRADAITSCLRTQEDSLSFWRCNHDPLDVKEVILALALGEKRDRLDKIEIVLLEQKRLISDGFVFKPTDGDTLVSDLRARHLDLVELSLMKLYMLASHIIKVTRGSSEAYYFYSFNEKNVTAIVKAATIAGRVEEKNLPPKMQEQLTKIK